MSTARARIPDLARIGPDTPLRWRYLQREVTRHGKVVWYVRKPGIGRVRIRAEPKSAEFRSIYNAILANLDDLQSARPVPIPVSPPTIPKPATEGRGFVYFLRVGKMLKIGFSKNPASRLEGLKTGLPGPIDMFLAVPGSMRAERTLHKQLADHRVSGEWFRASPAVLKTALRYAVHGKVLLR